MKRTPIFLLLMALYCDAQQVGTPVKFIYGMTVANLPTASNSKNQYWAVFDGSSATDCSTGGGTTMAICFSNGSTWTAATGGSGGSGVSAVTGTANQITVANGTTTPALSIASPFIFPGEATFSASTTGAASFNIPSGTEPTSPVQGDQYAISGYDCYYNGTQRICGVGVNSGAPALILGQPMIGTGSHTLAPTVNYFDGGVQSGANFCDKFLAAITQASSNGYIWMSNFTTSQTCAATAGNPTGNPFSSLGNGEHPLRTRMPSQPITTSVPWSAPGFDVVLTGTGNEGDALLQASGTYATNGTVSITAWNIGTAGTDIATFTTSTQAFVAGQFVNLSAFATSTFFNGQTCAVSATGLTPTQFECAIIHAAGSATESGTGTIATPLLSFGQVGSNSFGDRTEDFRLNAAAHNPGTQLLFNGSQEYSGPRRTTIFGNNDATITGDALLLYGTNNLTVEDSSFGSVGNNNAINFLLPGGGNALAIRNTCNNSTFLQGNACLYFSPTQFQTTNTFIAQHSETFRFGAWIGANHGVTGVHLDTSGPNTTDVLYGSPAGSPGGIQVLGINDEGTAENLVVDGSFSTSTFAISAWSITSNVASFTTGTQALTAGQVVLLDNFATSLFFNGYTCIVSATGLTTTAFQCPVTHANGSGTEVGAAFVSPRVLSDANYGFGSHAALGLYMNSTAALTGLNYQIPTYSSNHTMNVNETGAYCTGTTTISINHLLTGQYYAFIYNKDPSTTCTVQADSGTINGVSSVPLSPGQAVSGCVADGTNVECGGVPPAAGTITAIQNGGVAITPTAGAVNLVAGTNITLVTAGNAVTIAASATAATAWSAITAGANTQTSPFSSTAPWTLSAAGTASTPGFTLSGAPFTGGSGTTTFPQLYINSGAARTNLNTAGTVLGLNAPSGFTGTLIDTGVNGGTSSVFNISSGGKITNIGGMSSNVGNNTFQISSAASGGLTVGTSAAASVPLIVGNTNASPSGDIQDWQANSLKVASIGPTGSFVGNNSITLGVNGGTGGSVVLNGSTSGNATLGVSATGVMGLPSGTTAANMVLTSPALGTPASGVGTNITAIPGANLTNNSVTATQLAAQYSKGSCTELWGGSGSSFALTAGDDAISNNSCYNDSAVTRTITAVKCRSDNAGNTTTVNPTFGASGTGTTILSGALTCGSSLAYSSTGTVSNASWTTGTGINPVMAGTLTGTSIAMIVEYTF